MNTVVVINCGSSSIKYRLFDVTNEQELASGLIERVGQQDSSVTHNAETGSFEGSRRVNDYKDGIAVMADLLEQSRLLGGDCRLIGVGHRVVHGGEQFCDSVVVDDSVCDQIDRCSALAPLHNPANLGGIRAAQEIFGDVPHVAVFDTAFFQTLSQEAYLYALPYEWYSEHSVRRYGFHGTSHRYVSERTAEYLGKSIDQCSFITLHLGNGCSMAAIRNGQAIDTTMGLTPLEGLVMGTRCGDIDPAIIFHMMRTTGMTADQVSAKLEKASGLEGISGVSRDMRDIHAAAKQGNERAQLAISMFVRRARKYIGAFLAQLEQCDAVVFTGGIGENDRDVRARIVADLGHMGIELDASVNANCPRDPSGQTISTASSRTAIVVMPTNEELAIARETRRLVVEEQPAA